MIRAGVAHSSFIKVWMFNVNWSHYTFICGDCSLCGYTLHWTPLHAETVTVMTCMAHGLVYRTRVFPWLCAATYCTKPLGASASAVCRMLFSPDPLVYTKIDNRPKGLLDTRRVLPFHRNYSYIVWLLPLTLWSNNATSLQVSYRQDMFLHGHTCARSCIIIHSRFDSAISWIYIIVSSRSTNFTTLKTRSSSFPSEERENHRPTETESARVKICLNKRYANQSHG